jgi:hypothetical protein
LLSIPPAFARARLGVGVDDRGVRQQIAEGEAVGEQHEPFAARGHVRLERADVDRAGRLAGAARDALGEQ